MHIKIPGGAFSERNANQIFTRSLFQHIRLSWFLDNPEFKLMKDKMTDVAIFAIFLMNLNSAMGFTV